MNVGVTLSSSSTPVGASFEYGISDDFSLGIGAAYVGFSGISVWGISGMGAFHLARTFDAKTSNIDPYIGLVVGRAFATDSYGNSISSDFSGVAYLGLKYYFNEKIGINGNLNLGLINSVGSSFGLGLAVRLK